MTQSEINRFRRMLEEEKSDIEKRLISNDHLDLDQSMRDTLTELSLYDNHPADLGTELYEREKDIALNETAEDQLQEIVRALERMDKGTYGLCDVCGIEIPIERLEAVPSTAYCIDHVPNPHVSNDRPVEEEFLMPPFGRLEFDGKDNETEFDSEDSWQRVARYGTSNSPAFSENNQVGDYDNVFIDAEEQQGYVEAIEGFLVTDIFGGAGAQVDFVNNDAYRWYVDNNEGDRALMESEQPDP